MTSTTIERNYRKNPHTARFLQTFHSAIGSNGRNYREEMNVTATDTDDLLALVSTEAPAFTPSPAQVQFIADLVRDITALDAEAGAQAQAYTDGMTANGRWTPGREGKVSVWIDRLKAKRATLRAAAPAPTKTTPVPEVEDGRYAVEEDGVLKFFKVKNGNRAGMVFLDVQASDDWHAIRSTSRIATIVTLIAVDPQAAMIRYGHELGECGRCGRTLTDEASRAAGIGPVCITK